MSTWHMFAEAGETFRWKTAAPDRPPDRGYGWSTSPLPSMTDLLREGCSKLAAESRGNHDQGLAMFRNGLGRVNPAASAETAGQVKVTDREHRGGSSDCLFKTASGNAVSISSKGLVRAKALLGLGDDNDDSSIPGFTGHEVEEASPVFRTQFVQKTGPGQSRILKSDQSSPSFAQSEMTDSARTPSSVYLHTPGGRSTSVCTDEHKSGSVQSRYKNEAYRTWMRSQLPGGRSVSVITDEHQAGSVQSKFKKESNLHLMQSEMPSSTCTPSSTNIPTPGGRSKFISADAWMKTGSVQSRFENDVDLSLMRSQMHKLAPKPPSIKFHTAGGRSISVSEDALQRARRLLDDTDLGTFLNEGNADSDRTFAKGREHDGHTTASSSQKMSKNKVFTKNFVSPLQSSSKQLRSSVVKSDGTNWGTNLISQFDVVSNENFCRSNGGLPCEQSPFSNKRSSLSTVETNDLATCASGRTNSVVSSLAKPLVDISNTVGTTPLNNQMAGVKRRFGKKSISSFKKPRISNFSTPLHRNVPPVPNGLSTIAPDKACSKRRVSTRYPVPVTRMSLKKYFGLPPSDQTMLDCVSDQVRRVTASNAQKFAFPAESGASCIGVEAFVHMLASSGATVQTISREWVANHYKWIVWKLASYERLYPAKDLGNFLTVANVREELKYRYEREVNHSQRSSIKKILEGDASPSSMLVLCISAIINDPSTDARPEAENSGAATVELTDGWYSVDAILDTPLSKQLASGHLFVGQKLRIWGAGLCGWVGPISPLEVSRTVTLRLHINGTYRAHWDDRLGFCNSVGDPLAFRCIKSDGGPVPWTLVGVKRIYPILYKERSSNGRSIVRTERLETKAMQSYSQRRSNVIEGIISEFQRGVEHSHICNEKDSEGAKLLRILETAAEPEVLMAGMSAEQLNSFTQYRAKLEAIKHSDMEKSIMKALEDVGLVQREVIPLMRVRVIGLVRNIYQGKDSPKEGLITIWNPSEKQKSELVEGQAYTVSDLVPTSSDADALHLLARGSTTKWKPLCQQAIERFKPFFSPRKSILLSDFGGVPLSSEFDVAAFVVFVGEVYTAAHQKKQWVFVADGSISESKAENLHESLLAICFSSPYIDDQSDVPINYNLAGSTVGFCNIIKREKDQMNSLWVAEATENSTYFLTFDSPHCSHLKGAAALAERWGRSSSMTINRLKERVLFIIGTG